MLLPLIKLYFHFQEGVRGMKKVFQRQEASGKGDGEFAVSS